MNVLIVEDERQLSHEIEIFLSKQGYHCDVAFSGKSASEKIFVNSYDFILLDVGLPDTSGFQLLKEAKEGGKDAAFILITARGSIDDKITGLDLGADDYLAKPFSLLELQARMQAILRRKHGLKNNTIPIHDFVMDIQNRTLLFGKDTVNLTKKEFDILHYMALHKNRVITRVQLTEHIWGDILEEDYESNYIDVHIKNLRKKLSAHANADFIETVRGIGYRLNMP
ncbi:MAG: response regulator transcription factor [Bacteroidota bacterium]|jgi:DNA-binding response OmpR family regulator|uniref:response regulator transcription factor n=1 Tax=Candidatus Pollutiaquabacter sp. TaxID=3416354 RepID=UPI001A600B99|nr:response regulator transcription factor [Bacteroidota bacterium]MBL7949273.1 response regulator transcription factor [Bacteroidia bacterium]MBP6010062.1 response regulator transcription factor [Bacteroidia bacterium]MBP7270212.1 response regulator transcription factor [Bacteroidia bacterium]MBP7437937.1 response regulator transcription factor [Bacteroidia bacterium]